MAERCWTAKACAWVGPALPCTKIKNVCHDADTNDFFVIGMENNKHAYYLAWKPLMGSGHGSEDKTGGATMQTTKFTRSLRALLMVGAVAAVTASAVATPALADSDDWHGHGGWGDHDGWGHGWGDRDDWRRGPVYDYGYSYGYAYPAYPYTYAAPAPVYVAPPSVGVYFGIR